jgi:cell division transport system permease protein
MALSSQNQKETPRQPFGLSGLWEDLALLPHQSSYEVFIHHVRQAWHNVLLSPVTSIVTVTTIAIALFLFSASILTMINVRGVLEQKQTDLTMSVFVRDGAVEDDIRTLNKEITALPEIGSVRFQTKGEALAEFSKSLGADSSVLAGLERDNPSPASFEIRFKARPGVEESFRRIEAQISKNPAVEKVSYSQGILARFDSLLRMFTIGAIVAVLCVLFITGFIIANTIKLALYAHRVEVEIMQLVGATPSFIRAPYLLEGFFQGVLGASLGLAALSVVHAIITSIVKDSEVLSLVVPTVHFLSPLSVCFVFALGIGVGVFGSFFALRKVGEEER